MKSCCLDTWFETNLAIRMITWEIMRLEEGDDASRSQDEFFPISYTCFKCGQKWNNEGNKLVYTNKNDMSEDQEKVTETTEIEENPSSGDRKVKKTQTVEEES